VDAQETEVRVNAETTQQAPMEEQSAVAAEGKLP